MFGGLNTRRGFVRAEISTTERTLSWIFLVSMIGIGAAIYAKGQIFDVNLFALDQSLLENMPPARQQMKLYEETGGGGMRAAETAASAASAESALFAGLAPEGWQQLGGLETFNAETLYEKINGRDQQYIAYDVQKMQFAGYMGDGTFIDIYIFDMGKAENAFGIYSVERAEDQSAIALGNEGYRVEASYFFWQGSSYVQVIASETGHALEQIGLSMAQTVSNRLGDTGDDLWGLAALPAKDRQDATLQYFKNDALSLDFLNNTYTAQYAKGDAEITAFVSRQPSAGDAEQAFSRYIAYLSDYGQIAARPVRNGIPTIVGDMGGFYDVIFRHGEWIAGITMATNRALAEQMVAEWTAQFNKETP